MNTIKVKVTDSDVTILKRPFKIAEGTLGLKVEFTFDPSWYNITHKTALFKTALTGATPVGIEDNIAIVPTEVLKAGEWLRVGVLGETAGDSSITFPTVFRTIGYVFRGTSLDNVPSAADPTISVYEELLQKINNVGGGQGGSIAKVAEVTLAAGDAWTTISENYYSQVVSIEGGITANSQVDLKPSAEQLAEWHEKDLAFTTENDNGEIKVYALGHKPEKAYTIQVSITEVVTL